MNTASSPRKKDNQSDRRRVWLLILLALLISFCCIFCSTQLSLSYWNDMLISASLLANRQADYTGGPGGARFAALDPALGAQAATDTARLNMTPTGSEVERPVRIDLLPVTPTPSSTPTPEPAVQPPQATTLPGPATTSQPNTPVSSVTSVHPTSTSLPTQTSVPTPPPTVTPISTNTPLPIIPTVTPLPSPTTLPTSTSLPTVTPSPSPIPSPTPLPPAPTSTPDSGGGPPPPPPPPPPPSNSPPNPGNDTAVTDEDTSVLIAVLANDIDPDGTLVVGSVTIVGGPANGSTAVNPATGEITYTPNPNFNGGDTFIYRVCDNDGACNTASVTVTVNPVIDPPVAVDDTAFTAEDSSEDIMVLINDYDVDGDLLTLITAGPALSGTTTVIGNMVTYNPNANFSGTDTFTYTISDGIFTDAATVNINVIAINDPPVAFSDTYTTTTGITLTVVAASGVLSNDIDVDIGDTLTAIKISDPVSGTLTLNPDGSFIYIPNAGFSGIDIFTYRVEDAIMFPSNIATVTITVF